MLPFNLHSTTGFYLKTEKMSSGPNNVTRNLVGLTFCILSNILVKFNLFGNGNYFKFLDH